MNMLLCKTHSKAALIQKIHKGKLVLNASPSQLIIVAENSIEVQAYAFDKVLNQFITSALLRQSFPFLILDSAVISNHLLLLTVGGLLLLKHSGGSLIPIDHIPLNKGGEQRDLIMYLKGNAGELVVAYSNTNLFFVYCFRNNKLIRLNSHSFITQFNICRPIGMKLLNSFSGVFLLTKNDRDYAMANLFFDLTTNPDSPRLIPEEEYSNEINQCCELMTAIQKDLKAASELDIYDLVFSPRKDFLFLISELGIIILKVNSALKTERLMTIDFEQPKYYVSSLSLNSTLVQLMFDSQMYLFQIEENDIKRCSVTSAAEMKAVEGFDSLLLIPESLTVLFYDFCSSKYFIQFTQSIVKGEVHMTLASGNENQSVFSFDSAVIKTEDQNSIYSICGLKGNSRLVKYEDALSEIKLKEIRLMNVNNVFIASCADHSNGNMKACVFSYIDKAALFAIKTDFSIDFVKDYDDIIGDVYSMPNSDNRFLLVFKRSVSVIQFSTTTNQSSVSIKSEVIIPLNSKESIVLSSSYYSQSKHLFYLISYTSSNRITLSVIDSNFARVKEQAQLDLGEEVTVSSMASLQSTNESESNLVLSLLIGTYQSYLQLIHYCANDKSFSILKENKYDIVPDTCSDKIVTESIKSIDDYVFISTRSGEFCALKYNVLTQKMECFLSNKFTTNSLSLHIAHVEKTANGYSLDLFNELSSFKFSIDIKPTIKVYKQKYIIKKSEEGIKSENNSIVFFKKMAIDDIGVHLYQNGSDFSFGYFSNANDRDCNSTTMIINDILHFNESETAKRLLSIAGAVLIILTDANKLYTYSPTSFKCIGGVVIDTMLTGLVIHSLKEARITVPNESKNIFCICLCGEYYDSTDNLMRGVLFIYQYNQTKAKLEVLARIPKFPKPIYDVCCTKNFFVTGMEGYICLLPYEIDAKAHSIIVKKEAKQQQYMNRIVSLCAIDSSNSNWVLVGDSQESFQLIDLEFSSQSKFEVLAADLSTRSLAKAVAIGSSQNEVMLLEKNGSLTLFRRHDELYEQTNSIDLKEYINNVHQMEDSCLCTGLLGSLYSIKSFDQKMADDFGLTPGRMEALFSFQGEVIERVSKYYFGTALPIEKMLQMSCPLKNVILLCLLGSLCQYHFDIIHTIPDYDELYKLFVFINEEVI